VAGEAVSRSPAAAGGSSIPVSAARQKAGITGGAARASASRKRAPKASQATRVAAESSPPTHAAGSRVLEAAKFVQSLIALNHRLQPVETLARNACSRAEHVSFLGPGRLV